MIGICFNCWREFTHAYDVLYCKPACRNEAKATDYDSDVRAFLKAQLDADKARCKALGVPVAWCK